MSKDYTLSRATAERLIDRFGMAGAIVREEPGSGPDYAPGEPTETTHACRLVITDYNSMDRAGTAIEMEDKRVLISTQGLAITPTNADRLRISGTDYPIISISPLEPAGVVVFYEMQVRM